MIATVRHYLKQRKLLNERRKLQGVYDDAYKSAKGDDEEEEKVYHEGRMEIGMLDEQIRSLLSTYYIRRADELQLISPPYSGTNGTWERGEYSGKLMLTKEAVAKLRSEVRKEEKERWEHWQMRLTLLIGFGGMLIGLVSMLKK